MAASGSQPGRGKGKSKGKATPARSRKAKPKLETRAMRKRRRDENNNSDTDDSRKELSEDDFVEELRAHDEHATDFTASEVEASTPGPSTPGPSTHAKLPYLSPNEMPQSNAGEKWFKEFIMELFVPAVVDGDFEEDETLGSGPTWSDSESEDEVPLPKEKPRPITQTEKKRAQVQALLLAGTKTTVIMETLSCTRKLVYKVNKLMKEAWEADMDPDLAVKLGAGRPRKRSPELLRVLEETYNEDPMISYTFMAKQLGVSATTISRGVGDLGMKSYVRRYRALITEGAMVKRVERSEEILEYIAAHPKTVIIFSDKVRPFHIKLN